LETLEAQLKGAEESLENERKEYKSLRHAGEEEISNLERHIGYLDQMIEFNKEQHSSTKTLVERYEKLYREGIMSWVVYAKHELEVTKIALELERLQTERLGKHASIKKLCYEVEANQTAFIELERNLNETREKARIRIQFLKKELVNSDSNEFSVQAPCSGTLVRLQVKSHSAVVSKGEILCNLCCAGEILQAELNVPESGIALIEPGQGAKLLYDAFPYQRYGVRHGTIRWVSPSSILTDNIPTFRVLVDLEETEIRVKGQKRVLKPGMSGRSEIVIGYRSLFSYIFDPIRQIRESFNSMEREGKKSPGEEQ